MKLKFFQTWHRWGKWRGSLVPGLRKRFFGILGSRGQSGIPEKKIFFQINTTFTDFEEISPLKGVQRKGRVLALQGGEIRKLGKEPFSSCWAARSLQMKTNWDRWEANSIYRTNSPWMLITSLVSGESHGSAGWKWNDCMTSKPTAATHKCCGWWWTSLDGGGGGEMRWQR